MKSSKPVYRKQVTGNHKENIIESKDQLCDICAQNVPGPEREKIFAFGKCDHHVCYVCSTRLRVLCDQSECPICREILDIVIFATTKLSFKKFSQKDFIFCDKYKIYLENKHVKQSFEKLLSYDCQECLKNKRDVTRVKSGSLTKTKEGRQLALDDAQEPSTPEGTKQKKEVSKDGDTRSDGKLTKNNSIHSSNSRAAERVEDEGQGLLASEEILQNASFPDIFGLRNHLNYQHKLKLCDLCLTHNKLFPFEYSYYDSASLRKHMKEGEPKTSHRGHPNCMLCRQTFFNNDELIRHMSREHFHCHFCGSHESNMRLYFLDYSGLREHFKTKHFLCERDNCRHEQFTSAFDNRIDYQMHLVQAHGNSTLTMSRGESRQQRTIVLEPPPHRAARSSSPGRLMRENLPHNAAIVSTGNMATANSARNVRMPGTNRHQDQAQNLVPSEFPALGCNVVVPPLRSVRPQQNVQLSSSSQFPALNAAVYRPAPPPDTPMSQRLAAGPSNARSSFNRALGGGIKPPEQLNEADFPPLPEQPKPKPSKKSNIVNSSTTKRNPRAQKHYKEKR